MSKILLITVSLFMLLGMTLQADHKTASKQNDESDTLYTNNMNPESNIISSAPPAPKNREQLPLENEIDLKTPGSNNPVSLPPVQNTKKPLVHVKNSDSVTGNNVEVSPVSISKGKKSLQPNCVAKVVKTKCKNKVSSPVEVNSKN
ncbi:MAG: hypothetical protein GY756_12230 [bacterium]|nr:hypothetical protein [bacterium]